MNKMTFTGERFVPGIEDEMLEIEHMQRYYSVLDLVKDKVVLDVACGEGYGSHIMSSVAKSVTGVDISRAAVENATENYGNGGNLNYCVGSVADLPFDDKCFDVIVSFETIEHIDEELQRAFLKEARRVLKEDGFLLISTPNKKIYSDRYNYHNEFHVKEFYITEFVDFLREKFPYVKLFNQYFEVASIIDSDKPGIRKSVYNRDQAYQGEPKYVIAVASGYELNDIDCGSIFSVKSTKYMDSIDRILTLQKEEEERNQHIRYLDTQIGEKDSYIKALQKDVSNKDTVNQKLKRENKQEVLRREELQKEYDIYRASIEKRIEKLFSVLETDIAKKNEIISELREKNDNLVVSVKRGDLQIADLIERLLSVEQKAKVKETEIETLRQKLDDEILIKENEWPEMRAKAERVEMLEQELRNKNGHIQQLLEVEREFEREKQSRLYKISKFLRKMFSFFVPANSKREFFLFVLLKCFKQPKLMLQIINPTRIKNFIIVARKEGMKAVWDNYYLTEEYEQNKLDSAPQALAEAVADKAKDIKEYRVLEFHKEIAPTVSIIIPVYNQFAYTYECLKSILANSGDISYEIIIGNDCSNDNTRYLDKVAQNIHIINNKENLRFLRNCNNAASYAKGKYILFLNNDTQVRENWLSSLVELIESDSNIGMVGSKLLYPDGFLQEAGGILWNDGSAWNYGNRQNPNNSEFNYAREVDYISGAAIMIRKSLWNEIGGFDERFAPAYCEDSDLAFEVRKHGYKVMYQPKSEVIHFEGVSNGTDLSSGQKKYQVDNQKKFCEKWKDVLERDHFDNGTNLFLARDRSRNKKHILVVDHYVPQYDKDAGSKTTFMYLKQMVRMGLHVTFMGDNFFQHEPYTSELQKMGILVLYGPEYAQGWKDFILENADIFDYYYLNRPHITTKYIDFIKENTGGKIIYYGHDLHFLRERRQYELEGDKKYLESSEHWRQIEFDIYSKSDAIYVPGSYEQEYLSKLVHDVPVRNLPAYIYEDEKPNVNLNFDTRQGILFVGGFGHPPNEGAVLWFAKEVFPKIVEKIPDIKWYIVGSKVTLEVEKLASDNIIILGFVSDERLAELYNECRLVVVPLLVGAGVKGKVVEAVYNRTPMVTTSVGAEGLSTAENAFLVKDGAEEMAEAVVNLYNDGNALRQMSENCKVFIKKYFTPESAEKVLRMDIDV